MVAGRRMYSAAVLAVFLMVAVLVKGDSSMLFHREHQALASASATEGFTGPLASLSSFQSRLPSFVPKRKLYAEQRVRSIFQKTIMEPIRLGCRRARQYDGSVALLRDVAATIHLQQQHRHYTRANTKTQSLCQNNNPALSPNIWEGTRGGGQKVKTKKPKKSKKIHHDSPLSASEPFLSAEAVGEMTLGEVGKVFEYAIKSTHTDFDPTQFMSSLEPRVQKAVQALDKASAKSRGADVLVPKVSPGEAANKPGSIDTFNFCAAMRILTEWRMVRQVPEGYKSFAVSMKMGHKDVVNNIGKMEEAAHHYIDNQHQKEGAAEVFSPTLRDLLQFEVDIGAHPARPKLKEVSGAMGLLWVRRQLHFQSSFFENAIDEEIPSSPEAFQAAYAGVYKNYHGRAVTKVFNYSLQGAPDMPEVFKCMNPRKLKSVRETPRQVIVASMHSADGHHGGEKHRFGLPMMKPSHEVPSPPADEGDDDEVVERWVAHEMEKDGKEQMNAFLCVSQPLISDLSVVIEEFNLNDPKRV